MKEPDGTEGEEAGEGGGGLQYEDSLEVYDVVRDARGLCVQTPTASHPLVLPENHVGVNNRAYRCDENRTNSGAIEENNSR
jgi:hypothetical protein